MGRVCLHGGCTTQPTHGAEGSKVRLYCKEHAEEGMADVTGMCCSHSVGDMRRTRDGGMETGDTTRYKQQGATTAEDDIDDIGGVSFADGCICKGAALNVEVGGKHTCYELHSHERMPGLDDGGRIETNCSIQPSREAGCDRADDVVADVVKRRCTLQGCHQRPLVKKDGTDFGSFCEYHSNGDAEAVDDKLSVQQQRLTNAGFKSDQGSNTWHSNSTEQEEANDAGVNRSRIHHRHGDNTPQTLEEQAAPHIKNSVIDLCCKRHGRYVVGNLARKLCAFKNCSRCPRFGLMTNPSPKVCRHHVTSLVGGKVFDFKKRCDFATCRRYARWGEEGGVPIYCSEHGRHKHVLLIGRRAGSKQAPSLTEPRSSKWCHDGAMDG